MQSPAQSPPAQPFRHPVRAGETLAALASRFALPPEALARANQLPLSAPLRTGQKVEIPGFISLPVSAADTLYGLRARTGLSAGAIARYNALGDESELAFRRELAIPAPRRARSAITRVRLRPPDGLVLVTRGGRETTLASGARETFLVDDGAYVAWISSAPSGALRLTAYDAACGKLRVLLDGLTEMSDLAWTRLGTGRLMLWLHGVEFGTEEPILSVLDPDRGEVYRQGHTEAGGCEGDLLKLRARETRRSTAPFREGTLDLAAL